MLTQINQCRLCLAVNYLERDPSVLCHPPKRMFWKKSSHSLSSSPPSPSRSLPRTFSTVEFTAPSWCSTPLLTARPWPQRWGSPAASTWSADIWWRRWKHWSSLTGERGQLAKSRQGKAHSGATHLFSFLFLHAQLGQASVIVPLGRLLGSLSLYPYTIGRGIDIYIYWTY